MSDLLARDCDNDSGYLEPDEVSRVCTDALDTARMEFRNARVDLRRVWTWVKWRVSNG